MNEIIHYYLWEIHEDLPGKSDCIYLNLKRLLSSFDIESSIPDEYQTISAKNRAKSSKSWFSISDNNDTTGRVLSVTQKLKKAEGKLKVRQLVIQESNKIKQYIREQAEFDQSYVIYIILLRAIRLTFSNHRQWDSWPIPINLEHVRNSKDISYLEALITYWQYSSPPLENLIKVFNSPPPWIELFEGMGGGLHSPISYWNVDDISYAVNKLCAALRRNEIKIETSQEQTLFHYYRLAMLYRVCELTMYPVKGEPRGISPLYPTSFRLLSTGVDADSWLRERRSTVSEEVKRHIREQNEIAMKATFGDDYKERVQNQQVGTSRMKSREERTGETLTHYRKAQLESIDTQLSIIQEEARELAGDDPKNASDDIKKQILEMSREFDELTIEKDRISLELNKDDLDKLERKRELLKRINEDDVDNEANKEEKKTEDLCGITSSAFRDIMISFDQIQCRILPSSLTNHKWPDPVLPMSKVTKFREKFYNTIIAALLYVNEDSLLGTAHEWILNHITVTMGQKIGYMVQKNKNKKIKIQDIWKYYTPTDQSPEGEFRMPDWKDNITELLSPSEDNPLFKDVCAFACDYWLTQHMGKSIATQRGVFLWDLEERMWDLKLQKLEFPYIGKIGYNWVVMFSWDKWCNVGDSCEDAVIKWIWEIKKRDWVVIDRIDGRRVSLKGTSIYNLFNKLFQEYY